jgi:hypothetical protein
MSALFQPVGIAIAVILSLYAANAGEVDFSSVLRSLVVAAAAAFAVWCCLLRPLGDARKAALVTSLVALLFWSSSSFVSAIEKIAGNGFGPSLAGLAFLWLLVFPLLARRVARATRNLGLVCRVVNVAAAAGVLVPIAILAAFLRQAPAPLVTPSPQQSMAAADRAGVRPDIYLIILDAQARDDELAEYFDMSDGLGHRLRELGFYVADASHSNYPTTLHSLPSMLNFDLIQNLMECTRDSAAQANLTRLVRQNQFMNLLKERGYKTIAYSTGISLSEGVVADERVDPPPLVTLWGRTIRVTPFEQLLLAWTPLGPILRHAPKLSPYTFHRERVLHTLSDITRFAADPAPTFVFAHVISPHEPFVFGAEGEDVSTHEIPFRLNRIFDDPGLPIVPGLVGPEYARRYRAQARYVGGLVVQAAKKILQNSTEPPIIIVAGDHGPYGFSPNVRRARLAILNAYYLPHGGQRWLYPSISPVNSLRVVLNHYFGAELPILPDQSFRTNWTEPCSFVEEIEGQNRDSGLREQREAVAEAEQ